MEKQNTYSFNDITQTELNNSKNEKMFKVNSRFIKTHNNKNLSNNIPNTILYTKYFPINIPNLKINKNNHIKKQDTKQLSKSWAKINHTNNINIMFDIKMNYCLEMLGLKNLKFNFNKNKISFEQILYLSRKDMDKKKIPKQAQIILKKFSLDYLKSANDYTFEELQNFFMKNNYKDLNYKENKRNNLVDLFNNYKRNCKKLNNITRNQNTNKKSRSLKSALFKKDFKIISKMNEKKNNNVKILAFNEYYNGHTQNNIYNGEQIILSSIVKDIINVDKNKRNNNILNKNNKNHYKEYYCETDNLGLNLSSIENDLEVNNFIITQNLDFLYKNNQRLINANNIKKYCKK